MPKSRWEQTNLQKESWDRHCVWQVLVAQDSRHNSLCLLKNEKNNEKHLQLKNWQNDKKNLNISC